MEVGRDEVLRTDGNCLRDWVFSQEIQEDMEASGKLFLVAPSSWNTSFNTALFSYIWEF